MNQQQFTTAAIDLAGHFGNTAHRVIGLYREGGTRVADTVGRKWDAAFRETSPKLTPETRRNATRTQKAVAAAYARGLSLSAAGAEVAVDTVVGAAVAAIGHASRFAEANLRKTA